jgi:hypothetical protein
MFSPQSFLEMLTVLGERGGVGETGEGVIGARSSRPRDWTSRGPQPSAPDWRRGISETAAD